ncbi:hypothetical protein ACHWQZ_G014266 [Mnemiopsis leidyi]
MHQRHGLKAEIPAVSKRAQLSVRSDYDSTFRVRAAQLFNLLPPELRSLTTLESFKAGLGRFLEQYPDTPPVPGYTPQNDNSLLSWGRTHTMQLSRARTAKLSKTYTNSGGPWRLTGHIRDEETDGAVDEDSHLIIAEPNSDKHRSRMVTKEIQRLTEVNTDRKVRE